MLPIEMREFIVELQWEWRRLESPYRAALQCSTYTWRFVMAALERHMAVEEWHGDEARDVDIPVVTKNHCFPVYDGTVIDWTARQFWPTTPFPLVEPIHVYVRRFAKVRLMYSDDACL